jgi:transposase
MPRPRLTRAREQKPGRTLLECLKDRESDVLRFPTDLRIPPTSNQAERDLRPSKAQQKISGRRTSLTRRDVEALGLRCAS